MYTPYTYPHTVKYTRVVCLPRHLEADVTPRLPPTWYLLPFNYLAYVAVTTCKVNLSLYVERGGKSFKMLVHVNI